MERIRSILACLFGATPTALAASETFLDAEFSCSGSIQPTLGVTQIQAALETLQAGEWTLFVTLAGQESPHTISQSAEPAVQTFIDDLDADAGVDRDAKVKIRIEKTPGESVEVFDPNSLYAWLGTLSIIQAIAAFDTLIGDRARVSLINPSFVAHPTTGTFQFSATRPSSLDDATAAKNRAELLISRREQVTSDWSQLRLFPDDFRWSDARAIPSLEGMFAKIENFLAVVSLADSTLKHPTGIAVPSGFSVRIKGHVLREETHLWDQIPIKPDIALRNLFQWCYRGSGAGPLSDKLALLRSYVSLYWNDGIFGQDLTVVAAVRSGFGMYLKRNLKEFIELRAKVAAFLLELDTKATKAIEAATGNLEKNLYGVVTFVTSVVLLKAIQDKSFSGAFSPQVALLGWVLVGFSALHAFYAWVSTDKEMDRASQLYSDLRKLYSAFFTEADFDSIFSSDEKDASTGRPKTVTPIERTKVYVRSRLETIMWVWGITLVVAAIVIGALRTDTPAATVPAKQPTPTPTPMQPTPPTAVTPPAAPAPLVRP